MSSRRGDMQGQAANNNQPRQNVYFVPRDGIDREVITADICRYLGNDALVRPGTYTDPTSGQVMQGYHITGYRNLTSAMIQSLKEDSARWDTERRSRTSGPSSRHSGASGAAYPGSDAPGYSGSGNGQQATYQPQYDNRQQQYSGQYAQGQQQQAYASQSQGDRYAQPQAGGAYPSQPQGYAQNSAPYVNVGYNRETVDPYATAGQYQQQPAYSQQQAQDPRYYQSQVYAQPLDPQYGRGNPQYPATTQAGDYASSAQPAYVYDTQYQTANPTPAPAAQDIRAQDPRATTSSPVSTQAQTGHSAPSSSRHHRSDREHRESRHSRR